MHLSHYRMFAVIMFLSTFISSVALAQPNPRIMLEKSQSHALDNKVRAFRVPVTNSAGVVTYYDVTVTLGVSTTGVVSPTAAVTATRSPSVTTGVIVPGTYVATGGATRCVVTNMTLTNGRIQSFFACNDAGRLHQLSLATGLISAGHPYRTELVAAGIHTRPDVNTYTWGLITNGYFSVGTCGDPNYGIGLPVGAKTNGSQLILSFFNFAPGQFLCNATFTKLP